MLATLFSLLLSSSLLILPIHTRAVYLQARSSSSSSDLYSFSNPSPTTNALDLAHSCDTSSLDSNTRVDKRSQSDDELDQFAIGEDGDSESAIPYNTGTDFSDANRLTPVNSENGPIVSEATDNNEENYPLREGDSSAIEADASTMRAGLDVALEKKPAGTEYFIFLVSYKKESLINKIFHSPQTTPDDCPAPDDEIDNKVPNGRFKGVYIVYLVEYAESSRRRHNPQALVVTDSVTKINRRYDVHRAPGSTKITKRIVENYSFKRPNGQDVPLMRKDIQALLVPAPEEPKETALVWFEEIVQNFAFSPSASAGEKMDFVYLQGSITGLWAGQVLTVLKNAPGSEIHWRPFITRS